MKERSIDFIKNLRFLGVFAIVIAFLYASLSILFWDASLVIIFAWLPIVLCVGITWIIIFTIWEKLLIRNVKGKIDVYLEMEEHYKNFSFGRLEHEFIWNYRLKGLTYKEIAVSLKTILDVDLGVTTISNLDQLKGIYENLPGTEKTLYFKVLKDYMPSYSGWN